MDSAIDDKHVKDILELQRLKGLYFYHLDHNEWDEWGSLFTADAQLLVDRETDEGLNTDVVKGIDDVLEYTKERINPVRSVHHGHTPLYEFDSDVRASGIWAMADIIEYDEHKCLYGYGHYREQYTKEDGVWKFSSVHLTRLKIEVRSTNPAECSPRS